MLKEYVILVETRRTCTITLQAEDEVDAHEMASKMAEEGSPSLDWNEIVADCAETVDIRPAEQDPDDIYQAYRDLALDIPA